MSGVALSRLYYDEVVGPALASRWPGLPYAAGRLGSGSDVLGFDDAISQDHDWGLRLNLLVPLGLTEPVDAYLDSVLPAMFEGYPTRFATTWDRQVRHRVHVDDVDGFVASRIGITASDSISVADWLSLTGQAILEVTGGPVFIDTLGELTAVRERLAWYPDDVWAYTVATDWARLAKELPLVGRAAERGDDLGSRVIAARLVDVAMHLAHLLERRWPPYAKWAGTSLRLLPRAAPAALPLLRALDAREWRTREDGLVEALRTLHELQRQIGLPAVDDPICTFWDRRYRTIRDEVMTSLEDSITTPTIRALPRGVGSAEQWSRNVDVLVHPDRRLPSPNRDQTQDDHACQDHGHGLARDSTGFVVTRSLPFQYPAGWVDGAPTSGIAQACAFCGTRKVAWVHPLAIDLVSYRQYGKGHTLPGFWSLCERCEGIYATGDDDAAVEVMLLSESSTWVANDHIEECVRKPLAVFRRADKGGRRFEPEPPSVVDARKQGFVPLRELTGVASWLGPLWPGAHRQWQDDLPALPGEEDDRLLDRWLVRSPWPSIAVDQTLNILWRWAERDLDPHDDGGWKARVLEALAWSEAEALAFAASDS